MQDMCLYGPPGPMRRRLAYYYGELTRQEVEYVAITRDTTEADLKQRREIRYGGTAVYENQPPVRAALEGRLLILDGLEKAERNVLPTLNNLLENREMSLDDGSFLMAHTRYDKLLESKRIAGVEKSLNGGGDAKSALTSQQILRVHPKFRVIALCLPVPAYPGHPLDPPLRSRFQGVCASSSI